MDVREYTRVLRKRWITIVVTTALFIAAATLLTTTTKKVYTASSTSFVNVAQPTSQDPTAIYQQSQFVVQRVKSYTVLVSSPKVLQPTIDTLHLMVDKRPMTVKELAAKVSASSATDTVILKVSAVDPSPTQASNIANSVSGNLGSLIESLETANKIEVTSTKPATPPTAPSAPRSTFNLVLGILLGLAVGIGLAVLREQLNSSIDTTNELAAITGSNPIGQILRRGKNRNPLVALESHSTHSEAYRSMRTNLRFANVDNPPRSLVVTSAMPREGKTTVACNLAIAIAESGSRVCLVDADLRRPQVGDVLGTDNTAGLTDVLAGHHALRDVLVPWNHGLLTVLTAGSLPPDPNALIGSNAMQTVLTTLVDQFDVVVIDTPPLMPVTDALVLGKLADGVVIVTRRGKTRRQHARMVLESLNRTGARLLGAVFNDVKVGRGVLRRQYGYAVSYEARPTPVDVEELLESTAAAREGGIDGPSATASRKRKGASRSVVGSGPHAQPDVPSDDATAEAAHDHVDLPTVAAGVTTRRLSRTAAATLPSLRVPPGSNGSAPDRSVRWPRR
jgi:capsular exopolysaccharide synthesis family protein